MSETTERQEPKAFAEALGVITMSKMMKRLKTKRVSWLKHLVRMDYNKEFDNEVQFGDFCYANVEEEAINVTEKKNLENDIEDETLEVDEIVNIKESKNHPLDYVIRNLNQRTLRSLELEGHTFIVDLIPFGHGSFDVIRPKGKLKQLKTMKANELKLEDIPIVYNFPSVFPEDLPVTAALIDVNDAQSKLVLLVNFNENYSKCLRLLEEVTTAKGKDMDQDSTHMLAASKVPMVKPENGASLPKTKIMEGVMTEMPIKTAKEKAQRRLEVKSRSTLMMGIPNEQQLKFNSIKDAKKLMKAVKKRFSGNAATRKTQKNLLKQQYENFTASSSKMLEQTFDRL
ncbi:hypothetical protein Tco_0002825 [Tanacetum coccineum]